jgi:18S rRNA (guanine1575-N7)-methyltransferase
MASNLKGRPEGSAPPAAFYNETEARKYDSSSRMMTIQSEIANRAIEMLAIPEGSPALILDIGCGSGLSGEALEEAGYNWIGCDISRDMIQVISKWTTLYYHDFCFKPETLGGIRKRI